MRAARSWRPSRRRRPLAPSARPSPRPSRRAPSPLVTAALGASSRAAPAWACCWATSSLSWPSSSSWATVRIEKPRAATVERSRKASCTARAARISLSLKRMRKPPGSRLPGPRPPRWPWPSLRWLCSSLRWPCSSPLWKDESAWKEGEVSSAIAAALQSGASVPHRLASGG